MSKAPIDVPKLLYALRIDAELRGDEWLATCPSGQHVDAHPSWSIKDSPGAKKHGLHSCFSCHYRGTPYSLTAKVINISFSSARAYVDENFLLTQQVKPIAIRIGATTKPSFHQPREVIIPPWDKWIGPAREYVSSRGITPAQVAKWGIGYAVEGRLAGRIYFPIRDEVGRLRSYAARTFVDAPKRYLNPDEGEHAALDVIWGEQYWPSLHERKTVVVLEGTINALAVERACEFPVAALVGSHIGLMHLAKLSTFQEWILLTDPDFAGDTAVKGLCFSLLRYGPVYRPKLQPKTDAQSIGQEALCQVLQQYHSHRL